MRKLDYIFTGCPRSGTRTIAKIITSLGLPCSHELFFGMPGINWTPEKGEIKAESSWLAVPNLERILKENPKTKIIYIIRDPIKVLNSMIADGAMDGLLGATIHNFWKIIVMPELLRAKGMDRYLLFMINWFYAAQLYKVPIYKLEDIVKDPVSWAKEIGITPKKGSKVFKGKANEHHDNKKYFTLEQFKKMNCDTALKNQFLDIYQQFYGKNGKKGKKGNNKEKQTRWS